MTPLKQIYIGNCKKAGFDETDIPDILKITLEEWLEQKRLYAEKNRDAWQGKKKHRVDLEIANEWQGSIYLLNELLEELKQ